MKKTLLLLNFFTISVFAQFNENFDASNSLPTGWIQFGGANGNGATEIWKISSDRSFSGANAAYVQYDSPGLCEDWLVTPLINLATLSNPSLTFYGGQTYTSDYGNSYQIKVSSTSQNNISAFTTIATYSEADFDSAILGPLISQKIVDLSGFAGQQIHIAFVMQNTNGDDFYVDNVTVTGTLGKSNFNLDTTDLIYPNPSKGLFNVKSEVDATAITVYNMLGRSIKVFNNLNSFDISELPNQIYFVKIEDKNKKTYFKKIIKT